MGGRAAASPSGAGGSGGRLGGAPLPQPRSLRERFGALRNLPPFLRLVWQTSPVLAGGTLVLRFVRALLPVATLFVGKLIIDEVVAKAQTPGGPTTRLVSLDLKDFEDSELQDASIVRVVRHRGG